MKMAVAVLVVGVLLLIGGLGWWLSAKVDPFHRVAMMTSIKLPENAKLVFKQEEGNFAGYGYFYIFEIPKLYDCEQLRLDKLANLPTVEKMAAVRELRGMFANKFISAKDVVCVHRADPQSKDNDFAAASSPKYIAVSISGL